MNKYKYKFTNLMVVLLALGMVVALACIGFNSFRFFKMILNGLMPSVYNYLTIILIALLSLAFIVIVISMLISSHYEIKNELLILRFGVIKTIYSIGDFKEIKFYKNQKKLFLVFKDDNLISINIYSELYEKFIEDVNKEKKDLLFIQISDDINKDKA